MNGSNTLALGGRGSDTFDLGQVALSPAQLGYTAVGDGTYSTSTLPADTSHQYQGFSNFVKQDAGTWTLTGSTANNGPWSVVGGTLVVNGSLADAAVTVTNATLGGAGTIGSLVAGAGGIVAPGVGAPNATLTVAGNAIFQPGSFYQTSGRNDHLAIAAPLTCPARRSC